MQIQQLIHVAIHVADVARSERFYREVLRLEPLARPAFSFPGAWFRLGRDQELHLIGDTQYPLQTPHRGHHFALLIDHVDPWETHLKSFAELRYTRKIRPDDAFQLFLADPDGNYVELCTQPGVARESSKKRQE